VGAQHQLLNPIQIADVPAPVEVAEAAPEDRAAQQEELTILLAVYAVAVGELALLCWIFL
jgi:hypothetical protein